MLYNEIDPFAADWLAELAACDLIPAGKVDQRSIKDLKGSDCDASTHFFAGIGGWPLALRLAGWPDDRPVWTGSCPCQPYSVAGKGKGDADERNLWPEMFRLVRECRPQFVFGEQVSSAIRHGWLDGVFADLEGEGYTCGAVVLGAHSVGAPHIRQRLYWVAVANSKRHNWRKDSAWPCEPKQHHEVEASPGRGRLANTDSSNGGSGQLRFQPERRSGDGPATVEERTDGRLAVTESTTGQPDSGAIRDERQGGSDHRLAGVGANGDAGGVGNADERGFTTGSEQQTRQPESGRGVDAWSDYRIIPCLDGKSRRVGRGVFPLAHGIPTKKTDSRMVYLLERLGELGLSAKDSRRIIREAKSNRIGRLKGYGNAIIPQTAAVFVRSVMEWVGTVRAG